MTTDQIPTLTDGYEAYRLGRFSPQEYLPMWHEPEEKALPMVEIAAAGVVVERIVGARAKRARVAALREAAEVIASFTEPDEAHGASDRLVISVLHMLKSGINAYATRVESGGQDLADAAAFVRAWETSRG